MVMSEALAVVNLHRTDSGRDPVASPESARNLEDYPLNTQHAYR